MLSKTSRKQILLPGKKIRNILGPGQDPIELQFITGLNSYAAYPEDAY